MPEQPSAEAQPEQSQKRKRSYKDRVKQLQHEHMLELVAKEAEGLETRQKMKRVEAENKELRREKACLEMRNRGLTSELKDLRERYNLLQ